MKILIVSTNQARFPYGVAPLGAACVTGMLREAGHDAILLDLCFEKNIRRRIRSTISSFSPDVVGLSVRNLDNCSFHHPQSYCDATRRVVDMIRDVTDAEVIAGGSAISVGKAHLLRRLGIRYGVVGEGERSILELLAALEGGGDVGSIPGVIIADGSVPEAPSVPPRFDCELSHLPMNAPQGIDYRRYYRAGGFVSLQTKRGCAFKCIYCNYPALEGTAYRLRPPEQCVDDIERVVVEQGLRDFFFVDSVFNVPRQHALDICRGITRRGLRIRWMAYCNPMGLDGEMAQAFKQSGCAGVEFGLDAAVDKMLTHMGKSFSQDDIASSCEALRREEIPFAQFLLFGGPGETWDDIRETATFLGRCAPANAVFASMGLRIYEDTPLYGISRDEGVIPENANLLEPTYYLSPQLGESPIEDLDRIASGTDTWITPTDWDSFLVRTIQKLSGRFRSIPSWRGVSGYGKHMRPKRR